MKTLKISTASVLGNGQPVRRCTYQQLRRAHTPAKDVSVLLGSLHNPRDTCSRGRASRAATGNASTVAASMKTKSKQKLRTRPRMGDRNAVTEDDEESESKKQKETEAKAMLDEEESEIKKKMEKGEVNEGSDSDDDDGDDENEESSPEEGKKGKKKKEKIAAKVAPEEKDTIVRKRWSKVKHSLHPTQTALGWDWVLFKMKNLADPEMAQAYLDRKPVPAVKRGDVYYVIDHHHTLAALEASGLDVKVTIVPVMEIPEDLAPMDFFWKFMENRGWSFIRNADYTHALPSALPKTFAIQEFHNDIYRSMGGFARVHRVLKRPKSLEGRLFFEFKWGYFFFAHSEDQFDLWSDKRLFRSWARVKVLVEEVDMHEVLIDNMQRLDVRDCIYLSENVIEPVYQLMMFYLRALCLDYEKLADEEKAQMVPELSQLFGEDTERLPADCVYKSEDYDYTASFDDAEGDDNMLDEYGDETDFGKWSFGNSFAQVGAMI
eukprot:CAMPEP_0114253312 /NCGR_PEP_ID=MMETSP0058-20121206/16319_1 /TAXON_ID=36894 /ORGANISM="Pyramimonas parkeae, CCMP726" /LENGTH=490 /DNA_ID=CAMNT_0001367337 /DNA_START=270 /DNA_END=1742 /DNA_ORIENTATION=+